MTRNPPPVRPGRLRTDGLRAGMRPPREPWRWRAWACVLLLAGALAAWWQWPREVQVRTLPVVATTPSQQFVQLTASGYVVAQTRASVAAKASGRVVELLVQEGSHVRRGDLMARIEADDLRAGLQASLAGLAQAQARLRHSEAEAAVARGELLRAAELERDGFVSAQALQQVRLRVATAGAAGDAAQAEVLAAQARIRQQQVNLAYAEVRAPFDGVVLVLAARLGDMVSPLSTSTGLGGSQGTIATLADLSTLVVEADVSESQLSRVRIGQPVEMSLDALAETRLPGSVLAVLPAVDRARSTVRVRVAFGRVDPQVLPDMSVKVNFLSQQAQGDGQRPVLAAPPAAIVDSPGGPHVFRLRVDNGVARVEWLPVKPGDRLGALVEVSSPAAALKAGDRLVVAPARDLRDGQVVSLASL